MPIAPNAAKRRTEGLSVTITTMMRTVNSAAAVRASSQRGIRFTGPSLYPTATACRRGNNGTEELGASLRQTF